MSSWAIELSLDANAMKEANCSDVDTSRLHETVERCFAEHFFSKLEGTDLHVSDRNDAISNAHAACLALATNVGAKRFITRLNLFRINDLTDLLPFLRTANVSPSGLQDSDEESTVGLTLTAVIQDLFLDGPEHGPKRPHVPLRKPTAKAG